jgi:hypothetical protein
MPGTEIRVPSLRPKIRGQAYDRRILVPRHDVILKHRKASYDICNYVDIAFWVR